LIHGAEVNKPTLWGKDFLILNAASFFVMLTFYLLLVITSLFAIDSFHSSPVEAGLASGIFVIGSFIARLFTGKCIERVGLKKMLYTGLTASFIMTLLYFAVCGIASLIVIRLLHGAACGIATTAAATIVAYSIPKERCGEGFGYFSLNAALAMAVGPFLGMFIVRHGSFGMAFAACAVFSALGLVNALFLAVPEIELTREQIEESRRLSFRSFFEPKAIPISIVCGFFCFCYSSVLSFLAPYSRELHLSDAGSFFFIVVAAAMSLSRPYTGRLFDSKGENVVMYPAILLMAAGMAVLGHARYGYALLSAGAFIGLGVGAVQACSQAIAVKVSLRHRLGLANSTFFMFAEAGIGLGPFILGLPVPFIGYRGLYRGIAASALAGIVLYYVLHGRRAVFTGMEIT
jgi:MFS family permease